MLFCSTLVLIVSWPKDTRLYHNIPLIIDYRLQLLCRHTEEVAHLAWERTEIPDMGNRHNEFDMSRTLTAHLLLCNLYTATVADDATIADALVLSTSTLEILCRTEYALAEETVTLWLVGAVVDCFRLGNLTERVLKDFLWRCYTNGNLGEIVLYLVFFLESHSFLLKVVSHKPYAMDFWRNATPWQMAVNFFINQA